MSKSDNIWKPTPDDEDYPAAHAYLTLLFSESEARALVWRLRKVPMITRQGKDLLRASRTPLLAKTDPHVAADLKKIAKEKKLSPVLLVRGDGRRGIPLIIADGAHRVCASWYWDENAPIACCLVNFPSGGRTGKSG